MSSENKESYVDEARRRIAHLSHKLEEAQSKIRTLEYDNAELVRWTNDICTPRLQELTDELVNKYNQKKYRGKTDYRWRKSTAE
jgi:small-conductance mechanosensitive channel